MTLIVDSFAWIELFGSGSLGREVRKRLESRERLLTPDIVLAEVARKYARDGHAGDIIDLRLRSIESISEVIPLDRATALGVQSAEVDLQKAAKAAKLGRPGLTDAILLAFARNRAGRVLTGDPHFESLEETEWLGSG